jgi:hypothetical protein
LLEKVKKLLAAVGLSTGRVSGDEDELMHMSDTILVVWFRTRSHSPACPSAWSVLTAESILPDREIGSCMREAECGHPRIRRSGKANACSLVGKWGSLHVVMRSYFVRTMTGMISLP